MTQDKNAIPASADSGQHLLQSETAYERIRAEIRAGRLLPGTRLTETELAERLQTSRTPVREAIRRLESEGMIDHQPRTGAVVRILEYSEIMELYEMRTVLEGTAARLAARAASAVELDELAAINDDMRGALTDTSRLIGLNRQFHLRLLDAARNRFLLRAMASVENALLLLGPSALESPDRARIAVQEHQTVLDALIQRDGTGAEAEMRTHMEHAQRTRLRMLRQATTQSGGQND
ncbi:GntR family transcriptional regulator [Yoonia sp.]|uniref:GntR family transcriptional regulator n=1 Tax=Yoonia sp. TaxID=2212373 RepID=UPI00391A1B26